MYSRCFVFFFLHFSFLAGAISIFAVRPSHFDMFQFVSFFFCFFLLLLFSFLYFICSNFSIILRLHVIHLSAMLVNSLNLFRNLCAFFLSLFHSLSLTLPMQPLANRKIVNPMRMVRLSQIA